MANPLKPIFAFFDHLSKIIAANGTKRIIYSIIQAICIGIFIGLIWAFKYLWVGTLDTGDINFFVGIIGLFFTVLGLLLFLLPGFIWQIILFIVSLIASFKSDERVKNIIAFIISIISFILAGVFLYFVIIAL